MGTILIIRILSRFRNSDFSRAALIRSRRLIENGSVTLVKNSNYNFDFTFVIYAYDENGPRFEAITKNAINDIVI